MQKFVYQCVDCGMEYPGDKPRYLCPKCRSQQIYNQPPKGVLKIVYDYDKIAKTKLSDDFISLLPIQHAQSRSILSVGQTPVYNFNIPGVSDEVHLYLKDDSQNPTYSFKDRASDIVSAYAKENRLHTIAAASTGNAGSSIAGICASQNQKAVVFVPAKAPIAKITQIIMYGAQLVPVNGTYDDAFDLSIEASTEFGWFNRNTAHNPLTIEGKKTVSFEIYQQFNTKLPDNIFVPVGDGAIISSVYKGFEDLLKLGLIDKIPVIFSVQAKGSNNINANINSTNFNYKPAETIADSISVDIPRNYNMTQQFMHRYSGQSIDVSDAEILEASAVLSNNTGLFTEPAAAAAMAGFIWAKKANKIKKNSHNLILLTGSGLKDLLAVAKVIRKIQPIDCDLKSVKKLLDL